MKPSRCALDAAGWTGSIVGLILVPKCGLCVSAYLLIGSSALWAGHELCGGSCGPFSAFVGLLHLPPIVTLGLTALSAGWIFWKAGALVLRLIRTRLARRRRPATHQGP